MAVEIKKTKASSFELFSAVEKSMNRAMFSFMNNLKRKQQFAESVLDFKKPKEFD